MTFHAIVAQEMGGGDTLGGPEMRSTPHVLFVVVYRYKISLEGYLYLSFRESKACDRLSTV